MRIQHVTLYAAAALLLINCVESPLATEARADVQMGQWVDCNGTVGTIENTEPAAADGKPIYVVQVWAKPTPYQVKCASDQLRIVPDSGTQLAVQTLQAAPAPITAATASVPPATTPPVVKTETQTPNTTGKVADGRYTCGKIGGGGGEFRTFGPFNIRGGQVMNAPFPDGWVVLSVAMGGKNPRGQSIVEIRYRTTSGNTDLLDCEPA